MRAELRPSPGPESATQVTPDSASEFISRTTVQAILDSATG